MNGDVRDYARTGLVHHMLHPECVHDVDAHVRTFVEFTKRDDMETFDCCLPYGAEREQACVEAVRACDKTEIAFAAHLFPLRKIGFGSTLPAEQAQTRLIIADMIRQAASIGATGFVFPSGGPSWSEATDEHFVAFADFCTWFCAELAPHGMTALLEPFDWEVDKRFLYGPTTACVEMITSLRDEAPNLAVELDVAHLPLMGEGFREAVETCAPFLERVHLGNCVCADPQHPRYGDTHPPVGFPGGAIDVPELAEILRALLDVGFLDRENRGNMLMEMTPWPGRTVEETIADGRRRLDEAWRMA